MRPERLARLSRESTLDVPVDEPRGLRRRYRVRRPEMILDQQDDSQRRQGEKRSQGRRLSPAACKMINSPTCQQGRQKCGGDIKTEPGQPRAIACQLTDRPQGDQSE